MKKLIVAAIAVMVSMALNAQTPAFTIKVPEINKVAKVIKPGVNLRQVPGTTHPKLTQYMRFGNDGPAYNLAKGEVVPIIEEKDGWLRVAVAGFDGMPQHFITYPWIKATFCTVMDFSDLGAKYTSPSYWTKIPFPAPYKGLTFTGEQGGMDYPPMYYVGTVDNNLFYCQPFVGSLGLSWDNDIKGSGLEFNVSLEEGRNFGVISYNPNKIPQMQDPDGAQWPDFSKFSAANAGRTVKFLHSINNVSAVVFTLPRAEEPTIWYFDWDQISYPHHTLSIPSR